MNFMSENEAIAFTENIIETCNYYLLVDVVY